MSNEAQLARLLYEAEALARKMMDIPSSHRRGLLLICKRLAKCQSELGRQYGTMVKDALYHPPD